MSKLDDIADAVLARKKATVQVDHIGFGDLDMLREHRNRPSVRCWLENAKAISDADQRAWFNSSSPKNFRIVRLCSIDYDVIEPIGLARVDANGCVGADAFTPGRGLGYVVFRSAMLETRKLMLKANIPSWPLHLWVFADNPAVSLYLAADFEFDTNEPVKWLMRDFRDGFGCKPRAYAKMIEVMK